MWWQQLLIYAALGLIIENFFTGAWSVLNKNWAAPTKSYLWMIPIYGLAGLGFDWVHDTLQWPFWAHAPVYVILIYVIEFTSGWVLEKLIGKCPWHYGSGRHTLMGFIRWDYAPFWFILALSFDPLSGFLKRCLRVVSIYVE